MLISYAGNNSVRNFFTDKERMKLYIAGNGKSKGSAQRDYDTGTRNRLLSYAFLKDWAKDEFAFWIHTPPEEACVFLDSGAFSAFTLGRVIDLGEYCDYVHQHEAALHAYAVLDVIGDAVATMKNLREMQARGLKPVPIYHSGRESTDVLRKVIGESTGQIAIGGMATQNLTREQLRTKLDEYWDVIGEYWPVRVHGLGLMAQWALERYPWYSADSSSAILGAGMGRVSRFSKGILTADGWPSDVAAMWDGVVADGVGRTEGKSKSAHEGRRMRNIEAQLAMERYVTDLWKMRGVEW